MTEPVVFISRNRIVGDPAAFAAAFSGAVELIAATKPRTACFAAFVDEARTEVRIVHVFPDSAALADHFRGAEERSSAAEGLFALTGFELYGAADPAEVEQLRREAEVAGVPLEWFANSLGGFLRASAAP